MRFTACLLMIALLAGLLAGCGEATRPGASDSAVTTTCAAAEPGTTEPEPLPEISWSTAFRTKDVPEGTVAADSIAFLRREADGTTSVFNVPIEEVYAQQPERLPRTHYFEQYMPQVLVDELLPVLDYAMANGCSRMCVPTEHFGYGMIDDAGRYLVQTYRINDGHVGALGVQEFSRANGNTLTFLLVTLGGMEHGNLFEEYREGIAAAEAIVDGMPENLSEREKMLYLYRYLTDNVRYDLDDYYETKNWCMIYDALVRRSTVCAGYTEALYVLCNLAGIDCFTISGYVNMTEGSYSHIWNVARIDGQYYQFDATWDAGLTPADYDCFGMSTQYSKEHHTQYIVAFAEEYCPDCPENLLPEHFNPGSDDGILATIVTWYYRFCNAKDYNPAFLLRYFGLDAEAKKDGGSQDDWILTSVTTSELFSHLISVMTPELASDFLSSGMFWNDLENHLMYRLPKEPNRLSRLVGLEENEDGTWTAHVMEMAPDGSFTPRKDRLTLEEDDGWWFVSGVETGVE